jgi:hypothetical protein
MKVTLSRHGGQAAGVYLQRPPQVVDSAALDGSQVSELRRLVTAAVSATAPARSGQARDETSYTITIEDDGHQIVLSQSDTAMSADFGKLLAWLQRHPDK